MSAAAWAKAIDQFEEALGRTGYAASTVALRVKHLRRFALSAQAGPWGVGPGDVNAWWESIPGSAATRQPYKTSVRTFYRWAYRTGRVFEDPTEEPDARRRRLPVPEEWVGELKAYRGFLRASGRPETTVGIRISHLRRFARETTAAGPWAVDLDDLIEYLAGKRWALEMRRAVRSSLRSFYAWGLDTGRAASDPAAKLPVVKASQPKARPVPEDAYRSALAKAGPREALMLRLSAELGLRAGEVCQVHASDLLGGPGLYSLVVHGKGAKERTVPVADGLASALRARGEGWAFPGNYSGHLSPAYTSKVVSRLLPEGVTMHQLRHRFATRAYEVDRDVFTVQRLLGHSSPETTRRYVQHSDEAARRLVLAVSA